MSSGTAAESSLTLREAATLVASWRALASGSPGARAEALPGAVVALFPQTAVYDNALLLGPGGAGLSEGADWLDAVHAIRSAYAAAGKSDFALWTSDGAPPIAHLGFRLDTTTLRMGMELAALPERPGVAAAERTTLDEVHAIAVAVEGEGSLPPFDVDDPALTGWRDAEGAALYTYRSGDDVGVFTVAVPERARRRGLATRLTLHALHEARDAGARTATLQSSAMAESLYARIGFQPLGRWSEWRPRDVADGGPSR